MKKSETNVTYRSTPLLPPLPQLLPLNPVYANPLFLLPGPDKLNAFLANHWRRCVTSAASYWLSVGTSLEEEEISRDWGE